MSETNNYKINYETAEFRNFITELLKKAKLKLPYIKKILDNTVNDKTGLQLYGQAFTHKSISDENYENYEWIGDMTANTCICWYLTRKFPKILMLNTPEASLSDSSNLPF